MREAWLAHAQEQPDASTLPCQIHVEKRIALENLGWDQGRSLFRAARRDVRFGPCRSSRTAHDTWTAGDEDGGP